MGRLYCCGTANRQARQIGQRQILRLAPGGRGHDCRATHRHITGYGIDLFGRAEKLDTLPAFPQSIESKATPDSWLYMASPNMDKYLHYLLMWHSNILDLADWTYRYRYRFCLLHPSQPGEEPVSAGGGKSRRADA